MTKPLLYFKRKWQKWFANTYYGTKSSFSFFLFIAWKEESFFHVFRKSKTLTNKVSTIFNTLTLCVCHCIFILMRWLNLRKEGLLMRSMMYKYYGKTSKAFQNTFFFLLTHIWYKSFQKLLKLTWWNGKMSYLVTNNFYRESIFIINLRKSVMI